MEDIDDDFFSDDGFEDLPAGTLLQLEQNAFRATQAQNSTQFQSNNELSRPPVQNTHPGVLEQSIASHRSLQPPARLHTGLTNDYGALDVGELDAEVLDDETESTIAFDQSVVFPVQPNYAPNDAPLADESRHYEDPLPEPMDIEGAPSHHSEIHKAYNLLTEKLAQENERHTRLMEELDAAKSMAATKTGEIAIIRSNQTKLVENYDRQLIALRKAMADETARHKEEVEAARVEGKMLATENAFLKQDLTDESIRANNVKAKSRVEDKAPPLTPKKTKVLPFRDGFDDDEIIAVSPSKSMRSKRTTTPTVPGKRKRKLSQDSPTPLHLSPQVEPIVVEAGEVPDEVMMEPAEAQPNLKALDGEDRTSYLVKRLLKHRTFPNEEPDIEVMARLTFPTEPQRKLSTILLEETANLHLGSYLVEFARATTLMWSRALKEKFFQPIPMFMAIIRCIIALEGLSAIPKLIEHLVPVLQESGDINGVPRFKHSPVSRQNLGQVRKTPLSELEPLVDSTDGMGLLFQIACGCLHVDRELDKFWRYIRYDFVLMMLNCSQPINDIILTLNLLSTSIRAERFGSIQDTEQDQAANENYIVDRVANLLSETPQLDEGQPPYTPFEVCNMRLEALSLLTSVAFNVMAPSSSHGSMVIASHPTVLARLVRAMHDELDALYSLPPEKDQHASLVNGLMRLVYGVMQRHPEQVDLQSKLGRVAGGKQKFLVVLTRLAFSEGLVLEAGIEDETVEMAHEILDDAVNPQEAEALQEAFSSAKREK